MKNILGLGYDGFHDSNVGVMSHKGKVLLAVNEERLSKIKKDGRFPNRSIDLALQYANDVLCVSTTKDKKFYESYKKANIKPDKNTILQRKKTLKNIERFISKSKFRKIKFYSHHDCHAASAYFFSGFKNSLVLTWDAGNNSECWNMTVWIGNGNNLIRVEESLDASPALDYTAITALLGFIPGRHEGKVTGLAASAYATSEEIEKIKEILNLTEEKNSLMSKISYWKDVASKVNVPRIVLRRKKIKDIVNNLKLNRAVVSNAIQRITEQKIISKLSELKFQYREKNICLAGGIFANILINKKIKELGFENIFIHPSMGDDGLGLGACAKYLCENGQHPLKIDNVFWGPEYKHRDIEKVIKKSGLRYSRPRNINSFIAKHLADDKIVAVYRGKMEYGPRALGNRSILCSAVNKNINSILNVKLKRSEFMPFAPITLESDANRMYKKIKGAIYASKFMTIAFECKKLMIRQSPAVVHLDKTARPQLVGKENPDLLKIIKEYKKLTGKSSLINTSFNMHESPIVCGPEDAIRAFKQSRLDFLVMEDYILSL